MITRWLYLGWTALSVLINLFTGNWLRHLHAVHSKFCSEGVHVPSGSQFTKLILGIQFSDVCLYAAVGHKVILRLWIKSQDPDTKQWHFFPQHQKTSVLYVDIAFTSFFKITGSLQYIRLPMFQTSLGMSGCTSSWYRVSIGEISSWPWLILYQSIDSEYCSGDSD